MTRFVKPIVVTTSAFALLSALAACSSDKQAAAPVSQTVTAAPLTTLSAAPTGTVFTATAHKGLEVFNITNGADVAAGTAGPQGSFLTAPTASLTTTATGYSLMTPDGAVGTVNTTAAPVSARETAAAVTGTHLDIKMTNGAASLLTYATYGTWLESDSNGIPLVAGVIAAGVITTTPQMPTSGTATYTGKLAGFVFTPTKGADITGGNVVLNANFANNGISGVVTSVTTSDFNSHAAGVMSAIYLTGGSISGSGFMGNAAAAPACPCTTVDVTGVTGTFGGKFYGPDAAEAAGTIAMTGGGNTVLASFGTKKN